MNERIVSNTGPLIALALVDQLEILSKLYREILVPEAIHRELLQGGAANLGVIAYQNASWIQVRQIATPLDPLLEATLDSGEASVIQLARERGILQVLIDERKGRKIARVVYDLRVIGTAGILVNAKRCGVISDVGEVIAGMLNGGYRIHESIVEFALRAVGEI